MKERLTNLFNGDALLASIVVLVLAGLPIFVAVVISNKEDKPESTTSAIVEPTVEAETEPEPVKPKPINLSGTGRTATEKFTLQDGLAVFKSTYKGRETVFHIELLNSFGEDVDMPANDIGSDLSVSKAIQVTAGEYLLNVEADGAWTVTIEQ